MQPDDTTKQKMLDILKRFHSEEEEEMDDMDEDGMSYLHFGLKSIFSSENLSETVCYLTKNGQQQQNIYVEKV